MTEPQSIEEFEHLHKDGMVRLENEKLKLEKMEIPLGLGPLDAELTKTLSNILEKIPRTGRIDPEEVLRMAISSLPALDAKRFLIDNLMEALKRGEDVTKTMERYQTLGLLAESLEHGDQGISKTNLGVEFEKRKSLWRRAALTVIRIGANAIKSIPKWIEIEPQIMLFPFPTIGFTLKGKGMTIQDLFDTLSEGIG